jgi:hypothetical protein
MSSFSSLVSRRRSSSLSFITAEDFLLSAEHNVSPRPVVLKWSTVEYHTENISKEIYQIKKKS